MKLYNLYQKYINNRLGLAIICILILIITLPLAVKQTQKIAQKNNYIAAQKKDCKYEKLLSGYIKGCISFANSNKTSENPNYQISFKDIDDCLRKVIKEKPLPNLKAINNNNIKGWSIGSDELPLGENGIDDIEVTFELINNQVVTKYNCTDDI